MNPLMPLQPAPPGDVPLSRTRITRQQAGPSLFERIGGREAVARIIDEFYDRVERDPELRPLFPPDMGPGREKQKLFFEQWLGGEPLYVQQFGHPRLRRRHFPFVIDQRGVGLWLKHMTGALRHCGVPEQELQEILSGLGPLARHMMNAGEDVPREPLRDEFLT